MKNIVVLLLTIFSLSSCGNREEKQYRGEYPTEFGSIHPAINVRFETRGAFGGKTSFDLDWVKIGDLITKDDGSKVDDTEKEIGKTFLHRTVARHPGVLVSPEPQPNHYRIYIPLGSRVVVLTEPEGRAAHKFSSYPLGEMGEPYSFWVKEEDGCEDQLKWDMLGKISRNNLLLQVDFHWKFKAPKLTLEQEASSCKDGLQEALSEAGFNPTDPLNSKITSYYQIWFLIIRSHLPSIDPLEFYLNLKSIDVSVQVAGVRTFKAKWN